MLLCYILKERKSVMNQKNAILIMNTLKQKYPEAKCSLDFRNPFELLIAVILSAQCTDERVNKTTPSIFAKCPTPEAFVLIPIAELETLIHPCGFYKTKSKNIKATCQILVEKYHSTVPQTMEELMSLPGVGRKTANVVLLEAFHKPMRNCCRYPCKTISKSYGIL